MNDTDLIDTIAEKSRRVTVVWLGILLTLSALLGVCRLGQNAYVFDELWTIEFTMGLGNLHQHLPLNEVISPPPPFYDLDRAPPWWHLWTHMEITHPPLYAILLRWWEDLLGDADFSGRLFSVTAGLVGVAVLFDTLRMQGGIRCAVWAGLLMTVACPFVEYSRITRGYTLLIALALLAANALTRLQLYGFSQRRITCFTLAILATAFTHYFAIGTLLALFAYSWLMLPSHRRSILLAYVLVGLIFAIAWGPFMWQQRHLFATDDPATAFLTAGEPNHFRVTLLRLLIAPVILLFPVSPAFAPIAAFFGTGIFTAPLIPRFFRGNPFILLWGLWLAGTIAVVAGMDFTRQTDHLFFIRYIILAGPAVYALIPLVFNRIGPRACHLACMTAVIGCIGQLPALYTPNPVDPRIIVRNMAPRPSSSDLLIVAGSPADLTNSQIDVLRLARYTDPHPGSIALINQMASPEFLTTARKSRLIFLLARGKGDLADYHTYLPDALVLDMKAYPGLGKMWTLRLGNNR